LIRVLIADDQALLRGSFRLLVDSTPDMTVVGEASDGVAAVGLTRELSPDIVLMDLRMPTMDGIEATRRICAEQSLAGVRVLVLTMFDMDEYVYPALRAGASGFLLKDTSPAELIAAIRIVAGGESSLAPTVTRRLISEFASQPKLPRPNWPELTGITERESEVLVLIASGLSNAEIAQRLCISLPTVKTHVGSLLSKLGARDRAQLVIAAYENGLVLSAVSEPGCRALLRDDESQRLPRRSRPGGAQLAVWAAAVNSAVAFPGTADCRVRTAGCPRLLSLLGPTPRSRTLAASRSSWPGSHRSHSPGPAIGFAVRTKDPVQHAATGEHARAERSRLSRPAAEEDGGRRLAGFGRQ
jgi:DNA-binding NarL/FixJ family response regulator